MATRSVMGGDGCISSPLRHLDCLPCQGDQPDAEVSRKYFSCLRDYPDNVKGSGFLPRG